MKAIETEALAKRFGRKTVLDGLDLAVPEGSVYGLIGSNGTGKTTTLKILLNILAPTGGRATVLGRDSRQLSAADLTGIGYVSENQHQPDWMTAGALLAYLRPFYPAWDGELERRLLAQMDLPLDRRLRDLSRGMRMKVALVSSLAYRPRLLVLDEPFSGLDPLVRDEVIEALLELAGEITILVSSHDLAEMESFASHIGFLEEGRLRFSEETAALTARFREVQVTLGEEPRLPAAWPGAWLCPESGAAVVRFVDSAYASGESERRVRELFPQAKQVLVEAMTLREIFVALARAQRRAAA